MKPIFFSLLMVLSLPAFSQTHLIGFKSGINWYNVSSKDFVDETDTRQGFTFGFSYDLKLKNPYVLGTDLLFSQKGFIDDAMFTDESGQPLGTFSTKSNYNYLSLPLKAGIEREKKISGLIRIGIVPSIILQNKIISATPTEEIVMNGTDKMSAFDLAGLVEVACHYELPGNLFLFAAYDFQRSFTSITNSEYFAGSKVWHRGHTMSVGVKVVFDAKKIKKDESRH